MIDYVSKRRGTFNLGTDELSFPIHGGGTELSVFCSPGRPGEQELRTAASPAFQLEEALGAPWRCSRVPSWWVQRTTSKNLARVSATPSVLVCSGCRNNYHGSGACEQQNSHSSGGWASEIRCRRGWDMVTPSAGGRGPIVLLGREETGSLVSVSPGHRSQPCTLGTSEHPKGPSQYHHAGCRDLTCEFWRNTYSP